jgi:hypothetical protein
VFGDASSSHMRAALPRSAALVRAASTRSSSLSTRPSNSAARLRKWCIRPPLDSPASAATASKDGRARRWMTSRHTASRISSRVDTKYKVSDKPTSRSVAFLLKQPDGLPRASVRCGPRRRYFFAFISELSTMLRHGQPPLALRSGSQPRSRCSWRCARETGCSRSVRWWSAAARTAGVRPDREFVLDHE